ncbi:unnamed protein product [Amaranthus hypochondriacus]
MDALDSPFQTLTFIPLNLGHLLSTAVNNLWPFLAVITAVLSFWKLRSTANTTSLPPPPKTTTAETTSSLKENLIKNQSEEKLRKEDDRDEGVLTKGNSNRFFTVYYERENEEEEMDDEINGGDEVEDKSTGFMMKRWNSSPELTVEMRRGDVLRWYSFQNRKVIDGSVVRLWEEEKENGGCSPRSCRSRRAVGVTAAWC